MTADGTELSAYDAMLGISRMQRKILSKTPQGQAALAVHDNAHQAKKLKKLEKHGSSPKTRAAAKVLSKAKKGDPKAKKDIAVIHAAAKKGDPKAKAALLRLHAVDKATRGNVLTDGGHPSMDLRFSRHRTVRMGCDR
jgi:hypothetical protein